VKDAATIAAKSAITGVTVEAVNIPAAKNSLAKRQAKPNAENVTNPSRERPPTPGMSFIKKFLRTFLASSLKS
jgi:hypothetical protein